MTYRGPKMIGDVVSGADGPAGLRAAAKRRGLRGGLGEAAGPLAAKYTRVGLLRRGTLEVIVANSVLVQELGFQKGGLLKSLSELLPGQGITNLRFRLGAIE